ncbi:MAG: glycosyltransferase family 2 protein [Candidatus Gastranaerophilales bacterium]|nr:glycosyltransferase family 2 protein [Candidatus Gastranaerophilales bacterium]
MFLVDLFAWISFVFLVFYILLQLYIVSCSSKGRITDIEKRNYTPQYQQNITVIVYSHNNSSTIIDLIETLKKQDYDQDKYSINVILDNCDDNSAKLLEILGGSRLWRISIDSKPIGRSKAIAWLLERILSGGNTNAFVFLDADCSVKSNFLSRFNAALLENPVLIGEVVPTNNYPDVMTSIFCTINKVKYRVMKHGRCYASLSNILDQGLWAIRQDILEKIKYSISDNGFEEYEYSFKLSQANICVAYSSQLCAYKQFSETFTSLVTSVFKNRYKSLITFKNNIASLLSGNFRTKELLLSLIYPSDITFVLLIAALFSVIIFVPVLFSAFIGFKTILTLLAGFLLVRSLSMLIARCSFTDYRNDIIAIIISPLVFVLSLLQGFKFNFSFNVKLPKREKTEKKAVYKKVVDASITDGRKELACQLEIKESENNAQIIFMFNDKKMATSKHLRIDLAMEELLEKLKNHGFALKICLNCGYFNFNEGIASQFEGQQGYCLFDNLNSGSKAEEFSYLWNTCSNIVPVQAKTHILQQLGKDTAD